jgi:DNA-binding LacI/PurR family transcriptional regulator
MKAAEPRTGENALAAGTKRPKIQDVALLASVSLGTVSAVLNQKGRVSPATRDRVQEAIARLGYRPDLYASNLARRKTQVLGVLVSNLQNPFFAETAQAIEEEAARHGFQISLMASNFSPEQQRVAVQQLLGARIAGLAVITSEHDEPSRRLIAASGVPAVFLDSGKPSKNLSVIRVDSRGGMKAAVSHLIELGHRELLFVRNSRQMNGGANGPPLLSHKLRDQGFAAAARACATHDLKTTVVDMEGPGADAGERAIASVFGRVGFTAVIAITDMVAMGVYRGLQARGVRIPQDISVVGFDNTYFSRFLNPPLSTVDVSRADLSRMAVEALLNRATQTPKLIHLRTNLVLRESTAPPPTRVELALQV